jgi:hypothetical protein
MPKLYDLVEQTSTTTGTSGYVMSGTVTGRRAFSALTDGDLVPYGAVDDAGGYEFGFGTWSSGTSTLARTLVLNSSNSDAAVSWAAGTRRIYLTTHANVMDLCAMRHNVGLTASVPTADDDSNAGYGVGSQWLTTNGALYVCADASAGAAVWARSLVSQASSAIDGSKFTAPGYIDMANDPAPRATRGVIMGNYAEASMQSSLVSWGLVTTSESPMALLDKDASVDVVGLDLSGTDGTIALDFLVVAAENAAGGDRKAWKVTAAVISQSGTITIGTPTITVLHATAGASAWDVDVDQETGLVFILATGEAATTIRWNAVGLIAEVWTT